MKVLILANYDEGLYKFRKEVVEELVKDNEVFISVPKGEYIEKIKELGCSVIETDFNRKGMNPFKDIKLIQTYKRIIKQTKADVVLTYTIKPNVYGGLACQMCNKPYVANITGLGSALENKGPLQLIAITLYKLGLRKAYRVFFQNSSNRDFMLEKNIVKDRYDLIPGSGVNLNRFKAVEYPNDDTIDFMYVGRIMKEKGVDQYLEAAQKITKIYPNTRFHICGFYEDDYKETIEKLNREKTIIYHGLVKDMSEMYKVVSCTVHPTYYPEGLSNVLLESCASGRPIITTDRPGCKEVVENGVNGYIVEQRNSLDLIEKIEKFINLSHEEKKQMGLNGRNKVEKEFDRKIVIDKYIKTINELK